MGRLGTMEATGERSRDPKTILYREIREGSSDKIGFGEDLKEVRE